MNQSNSNNNRTSMSRRSCVKATVGLFGTMGVHSIAQASRREAVRPLIVSTWPFGKPANEVAFEKLRDGASTLDAVEMGIRQAEAAGLNSVGMSGNPNAAGYVQQDACIMHGPKHQAGSVAAVEGIVHPITLARRVMEKSPHVMIVGEGAREFAIQNNVKVRDIQKHKAQFEEWKLRKPSVPKQGSRDNHDTISLLVLGEDGTISGGCSTSGLGGKHPGRVGDSPILGSGLYVDNEVGAAGATGIGENIMRYCATFMIVEFMRQGMLPTEACQSVIRRIMRQDPNRAKLSINFVALDKKGNFGAAGTDDFPYAVCYPEYSQVLKAQATN